MRDAAPRGGCDLYQDRLMGTADLTVPRQSAFEEAHPGERMFAAPPGVKPAPEPTSRLFNRQSLRSRPMGPEAMTVREAFSRPVINGGAGIAVATLHFEIVSASLHGHWIAINPARYVLLTNSLSINGARGVARGSRWGRRPWVP